MRTRGRWENATVFGLAGREAGRLRRAGDHCHSSRAVYCNKPANISVDSVVSKAVTNDTAIGNRWRGAMLAEVAQHFGVAGGDLTVVFHIFPFVFKS